MAKNKGRAKLQDDEVIDQDEVIYEEEGKSKTTAPQGKQTVFEKYRNYFYIGGVAVVAIVGYLFYSSSSKKQANIDANIDMIGAVLDYERDSISKAINGDGGSTTGLIEIVDEYGSSDAGNLARYYLGTAYLKQDSLDEGIEALEAYKKGRSMVSAAAYGALGYAYEQKGDFEKAAENYKEASKTPKENLYTTPFYLAHAARNYESAGNNEEALKVYKDIRSKYPLSEQMRDGSVDKYIAKLSPDDWDE
jgi:tetratricopeptide (TPR) repeat protein